MAAVGLISAVAAGLTDSGLGRYLHHRAVAMLEHTARVAPGMLVASRRIGRRACTRLTRSAGFGSRRANPAVVALASAMINDTSPVTVSGFLASLRTFDESATLSLLHDLPALVLVGSDDLMTPPSHSVEIAARLARAELVRLDGAGHSCAGTSRRGRGGSAAPGGSGVPAALGVRVRGVVEVHGGTGVESRRQYALAARARAMRSVSAERRL